MDFVREGLTSLIAGLFYIGIVGIAVIDNCKDNYLMIYAIFLFTFPFWMVGIKHMYNAVKCFRTYFEHALKSWTVVGTVKEFDTAVEGHSAIWFELPNIPEPIWVEINLRERDAYVPGMEVTVLVDPNGFDCMAVNDEMKNRWLWRV